MHAEPHVKWHIQICRYEAALIACSSHQNKLNVSILPNICVRVSYWSEFETAQLRWIIVQTAEEAAGILISL